MERKPHKSSWSDRKRRGEPDLHKKEEEPVMDSDIRDQLNKIKKYAMICAVIAVAPVLIYFFYGPIIMFTPFINLIIVFIVVFVIYFPVSELLKKPNK